MNRSLDALLALLLALAALPACGAGTPESPASRYVQWGYKGDAGIAALAVPDHDGDGLDNSWDRCPDLAEDADGFRDDDGCPDADHDGDGIPDGKEP